MSILMSTETEVDNRFLNDFVFDFLCKISTFTFAINNTKMNGRSKLEVFLSY